MLVKRSNNVSAVAVGARVRSTDRCTDAVAVSARRRGAPADRQRAGERAEGVPDGERVEALPSGCAARGTGEEHGRRAPLAARSSRNTPQGRAASAWLVPGRSNWVGRN